VPFDFVRQATEAHEIKINNGGDQFRNFVDIRHVVEQEIGSTKFEIRDIYGNMTTTIKEFAQIVAEEVERKIDRTVNVTVRGNTHHSKAAAPFNFQASGYSSYPSLRSFINDCVTAVRAQSTD
jgi:nucleoside-diphosphate-sugar epimerase